MIRSWISLVKSCPDLWVLGWAGGPRSSASLTSKASRHSQLACSSGFPSPTHPFLTLQGPSGPSRPSAPLMTKRGKSLPERFSRQCCCPTPAAAARTKQPLQTLISASSSAGQASRHGRPASRARANLEKGPLMTSRRHRLGPQFPRLLPTIPESPPNNGVCQMRNFFPSLPFRPPFHSLRERHRHCTGTGWFPSHGRSAPREAQT